jgi:hypothetical protein
MVATNRARFRPPSPLQQLVNLLVLAEFVAARRGAKSTISRTEVAKFTGTISSARQISSIPPGRTIPIAGTARREIQGY